MRSMPKALTVILLAALFISACGIGDDDSDSAEDSTAAVNEFAVDTVTAAIAAEWDEVYNRLHPGQQAVVNRDLFIACRVQVSIPPYSVAVNQTGHSAMVAPEIFERESWSVEMSLTHEGFEPVATTLNVYQEESTTSWYLDQASIDAFRAGQCDLEPQLASDFALQIANAEIAGDWAFVYDGLHPNQQQVVPRELFLECRAGALVQPTSASVFGSVTETITVPEVPDTESYAVTLEGQVPNSEPLFFTWHIYDVGDRFAWVLGEESITPFKAGQCG